MKALYVLILAIAIVSCGDSKRTILYNKVMDVHDEVMPKMDDIYKQKRALQAKLANKPTDSADIQHKIIMLDSADYRMMDWMHQFNPPDEKASDEEAEAYFEDQLTKVNQMRDYVLTAIGQKK
jgi:hypothetical protein